jgi:hypothetical protein
LSLAITDRLELNSEAVQLPISDLLSVVPKKNWKLS